MRFAELVERLGYTESENYLCEDRGDFNHIIDSGHLFRQAAKKPCCLKGVYALKPSETCAIPIVYVCDVVSDNDAREVHRLVWNQDTVPFLIVNSPACVHLYPGFCRQRENASTHAIEVVENAFAKADIDAIASTLSASAVDNGDIWRDWGWYIRPEHRVDWSLLDNLEKLDVWLRQEGGLDRSISHALIGKYVYLHYLRDRGILSQSKLDRWKISRDAVFGRNATRDGLSVIQEKLDDWLNGEVFPIDFRRGKMPSDDHIRRVAATFQGDEPVGTDQWQLHLDFKAYDFSYIPIEVLSVIYEQFLHTVEDDGTENRGRSAGAYYTPIPVVNLMLSELEERRPLRKGMRIFDPACGSGAFLVQAFRRLIEKEYPPSNERPTPGDLRTLLEDHFFGIDTDIDACAVTRLSLILTLLDYVYPPDLEMNGRPGRKPPLPDLRENIRRGNFFRAGRWQRIFDNRKADWVVGNPPWKQLKTPRSKEKDSSALVGQEKEDEFVRRWMHAHKKNHPVGNRQMARAFAWRAAEYVSTEGQIALFLPAMTLFEEAARSFRSRFFHDMAVHTVANFSNLRWVISGGRFTAPAAAFFYRPRYPQGRPVDEDESIRTYSPLLANQEATRPTCEGERNETWNLVVNASEIRDIPRESVADGKGLAWKMASWGSDLDAKLIRLLQRRFDTMGDMEEEGLIVASQGLELRPSNVSEDVERVSLPADPNRVDLSVLANVRDFFALPRQAVKKVPEELTHARKGRVELPLSVCQPPHVLVSETRSFAIYSDEFLVVPSRQIGIVSPKDDIDLLKALALFLKSDLAFYCEFFLSSGFGIERGRSTLKALRRVPTPLTAIARHEIQGWARFYDVLHRTTREAFEEQSLWREPVLDMGLPAGPVVSPALMEEMNDIVFNGAGLERAGKERRLVHDFVHTRFSLNDGNLGKAAISRPTKAHMEAYARRLRAELDDYISGEMVGSHDVAGIYDDYSGMIRVALVREGAARGQVFITRADVSEAAALERCRQWIRRKKSQWVYFDRNLHVYDGHQTYILKPMQRFHWTDTQARIDAMDVVSESIARREKA